MHWNMTTRKFILLATMFFGVGWVLVSLSHAQNPVQTTSEPAADTLDSLLESATAPIPPQEPVETNRVKLLLREASDLRDPFWPVGYTPPRKEASKPKNNVEVGSPSPPQPVVVERPPRWDEALRTVSIKGIMSVGGGKFTAVVNDQIVNEEDTVSVVFEGRKYIWKVARISADGVKFQKLSVSK